MDMATCPHCGKPLTIERVKPRKSKAEEAWYYEELENRHYQWRAQHIFTPQPGCVVRPSGFPIELDYQV
jgi:hypothetical protein